MNSSVYTDLSLAEIQTGGYVVSDASNIITVFTITGHDATRYLHGRLTQDLKGLGTGQGAHSLLLLPNGRIQGVCLIVKTSEGYLILADTLTPDMRTQFALDLLQFKVSDDIQCTPTDPAVIVLLGSRSLEALSTAAKSGVVYCTLSINGMPVQQISDFTGLVPLSILLIERDNAQRCIAELISRGMDQESEDFLEVVRVLSGIPRMGTDITERTLAADLPVEHYVSFTKGCYVGQEVVEMATARGRPNRRLARLICSPLVEISPGAEIRLTDSTDQRSAGTVTSVCLMRSQNTTVCLAFLPSSLAFPTQVLIDGKTFAETDRESF